MTENKFSNTTPIIKHIVCSGGGVAGFTFYGILKEANKQGIWDIENIETMYGTSVGSIVNTILSLKYDWKDIDDYLMKRPWDMVYNVNMYSFFELFLKKGVFDRMTIQETMSPLLKGKELSLDITMQELYDYNHIEIHIFITEMNEFKTIDISFKTHPEWKLIDAIYASCSFPIIFPPFVMDTYCYYDGGILMNYPLIPCIENGANPDEILSINSCYSKVINKLNENSTLLDNISVLVYSYIYSYNEKNTIDIQKTGKYHINVEIPTMTIQLIMNVTSNQTERIKLIEYGEQIMRNMQI